LADLKDDSGNGFGYDLVMKNFLGPEIVNSEIVLNSKLPEPVKSPGRAEAICLYQGYQLRGFFA
jgi:hypothetical protein